MPLAFDRAEYARRLTRTREAMRAAGLDALLVFHQENMFYLAGYDQIGYWIYQVLIVPAAADREMTAMVRLVDEPLIREAGIVRDIRLWGDHSADHPAALTAKLLDELGLLSGKRIGLEKKSHALLAANYEALKEVLAPAEQVDASDLIAELRVVKSAAEIAHMRRAGEIMDLGVRAGFERLGAGVRECDVAAAIMEAMYSAGGDPPALPPPMGSGPRTLTRTHGAHTTRRVEAGEPFLLEVGGSWNRYHSVCMRMASVGPPSASLQRLHGVLRDATDRAMEQIKPGLPAAELARLVGMGLARHGYSQPGVHAGYGIGLGYPPTWVDNLRIKPADPHILEAGMAFHLFMSLTERAEQLHVCLGDPILVTPSGYERLTRLPRDITVR